MKFSMTSPTGTLKFEATKRETVIGRADTSDWVIPSEKLSRSHCIVYLIKDKEKGTERISIMDPGSKNGVTVDGKRIRPEEMTPISSNTLVVLANEFILQVGEKKPNKMIETAVNISAPVKSRPKHDLPEEHQEYSEIPAKIQSAASGLKRLIKKLVLIAGAIIVLLGAAIFFLLYR